jgi:hypothetical protein
MTHTRWLALFLAGAALLQDASVGHAQRRSPQAPAKKEYVEFSFDGDLGQILTQKLQGYERFKQLFDKLPPNLLKQFNLSEQTLGRLTADHPRVRQVLEDLALKQAKGKLTSEDVKTAQQQLQEAAKAPPKIGPEGDNKVEPPELPKIDATPPIQGPQGPLVPPVEDEPGWQDRVLRWAENLFEGLEQSAFGKQLRELESTLLDRFGSKLPLPIDGLEKLGARLKLPQFLDFSLPEIKWLKVPNVSLPSLPSLPRPNFNLSLPSFDFGGVNPGGGVPSVSGAAFGTVALWVGLVLLLALVLWRLGGRSAWLTRRAGAAGWMLGPWPVNPAGVSTRAELVQAFEYLALLRLGQEARVWNHRDIACRLSPEEAEGARRSAAEELATLYEQARYTPDDEPLSPPALDAARRDLCLLAGVAPA